MGIFSGPKPDLESIRADIESQTRRVQELLAQLEGIERDVTIRFRELEERADRHERAVRTMAEELDERIDRGNKIWRKIRASEYYEKQREEGEEDGPSDLQFHLGDGEVSSPEAMPTMRQGMGFPRRTLSPAQQVGKAFARRLAGME